jgi:uncharacterized protein DUF4062/NACHT domain-containing protein/HEAT repeat protein
MARIYISSTSIDLEDYRKTVGEALRRLGHEDVAMDYYVAEDKRPLDRSLSDVAACDVYIGIFAYRYGHVPKENNPQNRSITELEYRKAQEEGIPCLIFLMSEEAPWPTSKRDKGEGALRIEAFREELASGGKHVVNFFESADELARKVNEAVVSWATASGLTPKRQFTDWDAYREAVINRHQWVRLQVIAGTGKDRGPVRIPLTEVFESQLATAGASGTEVPDEVRKYQEVIYGPRAEWAAATEDVEPLEEDAEPESQDPLLVGNPEQVLDLVGREATQVILGGPGSGKSTILHYVMLRVCQIGAAREALPIHLQDSPIPFLIDLRSYVLQKAPDFPTYIVNNALDLYDASIDKDNLTTVLQEPRQALVLFDGLDEVFDPDERRRVVNQFQAFAHRYPQARLIVTSRIAGYDRTALGLAGFEHYTLLPLTLGQIRHFAEQWYQYYTFEDTDRSAQGLVQRIIESPRLLDLAGNPLLLTMMAVIYKDRDLPNERWRLYERCAETLLEDWELSKGIEDEDFKLDVNIRTGGKSEILQRVSMYMLDHGQQGRELNAIAYGPLLNIVATYLQEKYQRSPGDAEAVAVDILRHLMERTYVLAGIGERIFGFVHRTFMEYFAACHCKEYFNKSKANFEWLNKDIFGAHWNEGEWEEVLLLLIAMLHDQKTPIYEVIEHLQRKDRAKMPLKLAFAARCLGEAGDLQDVSQGQTVLEKLATAISDAADKSAKSPFLETALKAFASLAPLVTPPPRAVEKVIADLDNSPFVASRIAGWQMGFAMRSRKERLAYALAALKDRNEAVRRGAIAALEREWPGRADIGETLTEVVRSDRQARVRQSALLAMQRSWRSDPAILDAISSRIDEETGHRNVIKLAQYLATTWRGNPKALKLIMRLSGPMPKARDSYDYNTVMAEVLPLLDRGWPGDAQALAFLKDQAINHAVPHVRSIAVNTVATGWAGKAGSFEFLRERATDDPEPQTRAAALKAIAVGWPGDMQILSDLQDAAVNDASPTTRAAALEAIGEGWGTNSNALRFIEGRLVAETDLELKKTAFAVIGKGWSKDVHAFSVLLKWAKNDADPQIRLAALRAISAGWGTTEQGFSFLKERTAVDPAPEVRIAGLQGINAVIMQQAFEVISYRGIERPHDELKFLQDRAVNEPDLNVRETALQVLASLHWIPRFYGIEARFPAFFVDRAQNDPEARIRLLSLDALWNSGRFFTPSLTHKAVLNESLPFLKDQATSNSDPRMRALAIKVIELAWTDAGVFSFLINIAQNDTDSGVRNGAWSGMMRRSYSSEIPRDVLAFIERHAVEGPDLFIREMARDILRSQRR